MSKRNFYCRRRDFYLYESVNAIHEWILEERLQIVTPRASSRVYIRFGMFSRAGHSYNHRDYSKESGWSVYRAKIEDGFLTFAEDRELIVAPHDHDFSGRFAFGVTGTESGRGTDGEPLIRGIRLITTPLSREVLRAYHLFATV